MQARLNTRCSAEVPERLLVDVWPARFVGVLAHIQLGPDAYLAGSPRELRALAQRITDAADEACRREDAMTDVPEPAA